jgi:hypothetical protein
MLADDNLTVFGAGTEVWIKRPNNNTDSYVRGLKNPIKKRYILLWWYNDYNFDASCKIKYYFFFFFFTNQQTKY